MRSRAASRIFALCFALVVALLLGIATYAGARFISDGSALPCQYHEAREGSGYEIAIGMTVDEFSRMTKLRVASRLEVAPQAAPGTIVRVSKCNVPKDADVVAFVAVSG